MSHDPIAESIAAIQNEIDRLEAAKAALQGIVSPNGSEQQPGGSPPKRTPASTGRFTAKGQRPITGGGNRQKIEAVLGQKETWRQSELAQAAGVAKGGMHGIIAGLVKDNMIRVERRSPNDVRLHVLSGVSEPVPA